jgi:soluble lytic murein transglycosylase-like protein
MARSLASQASLAGIVTAAAVAALGGVRTAPRPSAPALPPPMLAAHAPVDPSRWGEAPVRIYEELERAGLAAHDVRRIGRAILEESLAASLDPNLVLAVIRVESGFRARAVSPAGAIGLMQLMPFTHREVAGRSDVIAADPFDPVGNVRAGVRYLTQLVATFGDVELALMAYNAGPARIRAHLRAGGVPTRLLRYPRDVLRLVRGDAARAAAAAPAPRLIAAHARVVPAPAPGDVTAFLAPQAPGSFAVREAPRDAGAALPTRRGLLAPAALLLAA